VENLGRWQISIESSWRRQKDEQPVRAAKFWRRCYHCWNLRNYRFPAVFLISLGPSTFLRKSGAISAKPAFLRRSYAEGTPIF
jgi:hypothetical protein